MASVYYDLTDIIAGSFTFATDVTQNQNIIDSLLAAHTPANMLLNTPPVSPTAGEVYIIGPSPSPTSIWAGLADNIAIYTLNGFFYITPQIGNKVDLTDGTTYIFGGGGWSLVTGGGGYDTIQEATTPVTQRTILNFDGIFNVTDNAGNSSTDVALQTGTAIGDVLLVTDVGGSTPGLPVLDGSLLTNVSSSGASIQVQYTYRNNTTIADPSSGNFRLNNTTIASATQMALSENSDSGADLSVILNALQSGNKIYIQNIGDSTERLLLSITSVTDNTGWFTIDFTVDDSNGPTWTNNADFGFILFPDSGGAGSLPTTTKGDLIVHNGTTNVRLPVGANGEFLRANSTPAEGIEWSALMVRQTAETADYTLAADDNNTIIPVDTSGGAITITLPDGLATDFRVILVNIGANPVVLSADTTLNAVDTSLYFIYTMADVTHTGSNVWEAFGSLGFTNLEDLNNVSAIGTEDGDKIWWDTTSSSWINVPQTQKQSDESILAANETLTLAGCVKVQARNCTVASDLTYPSLSSTYELIGEGRNNGVANITVRNHDATLLATITPGQYWRVFYNGTDWKLLFSV